jgi:hypothetical protein
MIRVAAIPDSLTPIERYGLSLILDGSGLLQVTDLLAPVVELAVHEAGPAPADWLRSVDGRVTVARAKLAEIGSLAGAEVEQRTAAADRHGRVPSGINPQVAAGRAGEPTIDILAAELRETVRHTASGMAFAVVAPWPRGLGWAVALTHDVDVLSWWPLFTALRVAELGRHGKAGTVVSVVGRALAGAFTSPPLAGIRKVCEREQHHGIRSTWFFLTGTPTLGRILAGDVTYRIEGRAAQEAIRLALWSGGEVGLHGSFATGDRGEVFATERARLQRASGQPVQGVRQHFLRMRPGATQAGMEAAGFQYDATWGFADLNGFRLGLAVPAPAWSDATSAPRALELVPLAWMDRVQSKYQGDENSANWVLQALDLADACREMGGLWCGLWHPNLTAPLGFPGALEAYATLCNGLAQRAPWFCTITDAVTWRQRRRTLRAVRVQEGGISLAGVGMDGLVLRDATGRGLEFQFLDAA